MNLSTFINQFNESLELNDPVPPGVEVMNPFRDPVAVELARKFYDTFYNDSKKRKLILGINPGRLGGGVTGIPFTDPVKLYEKCGIQNQLKKVTEPSAGFIYDMIDAFGTPESFYKEYYVYAVCPLGFTKDGVNYNYYDSRELEEAVTPFIVSSMQKLFTGNMDTNKCFCLGNGKNFKYLSKLNKVHHFFEEIVPLPHPRWIVQYRRKQYDEFIEEYLKILK